MILSPCYSKGLRRPAKVSCQQRRDDSFCSDEDITDPSGNVIPENLDAYNEWVRGTHEMHKPNIKWKSLEGFRVCQRVCTSEPPSPTPSLDEDLMKD